MAVLEGWKYDEQRDVEACIYANDVTEGNILAISDASTSPMTVDVAGAGAVPVGVAPETRDISEDGAYGTMVRNGFAPVVGAAAVTDASLPVKCAASGQATPVTTDLDVMVGYPMHTASSGSTFLVDLKLMGSFYGV